MPFVPIEPARMNNETITELQNLRFEGGAYFSSYLELRISKSRLTAQRRPALPEFSAEVKRTLSPEELESLIHVLNKVKVLEWKLNYEDHQGVLDGYSWSLYLVYNGGKRKKTSGYVNTPENYEELEEMLEKLAVERSF